MLLLLLSKIELDSGKWVLATFLLEHFSNPLRFDGEPGDQILNAALRLLLVQLEIAVLHDLLPLRLNESVYGFYDSGGGLNLFTTFVFRHFAQPLVKIRFELLHNIIFKAVLQFLLTLVDLLLRSLVVLSQELLPLFFHIFRARNEVFSLVFRILK